MNLINKDFLSISPNFHATENLGLLLHSYVIFNRPESIIEVGGGYSTFFIAQAIEDVKNNVTECGLARKHMTRDRKKFMEGYNPEFTLVERHLETASEEVLKKMPERSPSRFENLKSYDNITRFAGDVDDYLESVPKEKSYDMIWLDFGGCHDYMKYFKIFWERLNEGGVIIFHSTMNNWDGRLFVSELKLLSKYEKDMQLISFVEPHKKRQNSITIIQKDKHWPIYELHS